MKATTNTQVQALFHNLRDVAVEQEIRPTDALRKVLEAFPDAKRTDIKHAAAEVGINPLTARNVFDKFHKGAK